MKKKLSAYEAQKRLTLFLKLRKGKAIDKKMIDNFYDLTESIYYDNFKSASEVSLARERYDELYTFMENMKKINFKDEFVVFSNDARYRKSLITKFYFTESGKYLVFIGDESREINKADYEMLKIIMK